jgi:hypothetical protein
MPDKEWDTWRVFCSGGVWRDDALFFPVVSEGMTRRGCSLDAVGVLSSSKIHNEWRDED